MVTSTAEPSSKTDSEFFLMPKKPEPQMTTVHPLVNGKPDRSRSLRVPVTAIDIFTMTTRWEDLEAEYGPCSRN